MQGLSGLFLWASVWQQQIPYLGKAPTSGLFCQIIVALRLTNTREIFNEYHIFVRKPRDSIKSFCLGNFSMSATVQLLSFQWCGIQTYKNLSCEKTKVSNHMPPPVCKMAACFKMYRLTQKNEVTVPLRGKKKAGGWGGRAISFHHVLFGSICCCCCFLLSASIVFKKRKKPTGKHFSEIYFLWNPVWSTVFNNLLSINFHT